MDKAKLALLEWRMAILWFMLFSVNAFCTSTLAALTGTKWATIDGQEKFLIVLAVLLNWTNIIMAYISKTASRVKKTGELFPDNNTDTQIIKKDNT